MIIYVDPTYKCEHYIHPLEKNKSYLTRIFWEPKHIDIEIAILKFCGESNGNANWTRIPNDIGRIGLSHFIEIIRELKSSSDLKANTSIEEVLQDAIGILV